jgi:hypothetical protein
MEGVFRNFIFPRAARWLDWRVMVRDSVPREAHDAIFRDLAIPNNKDPPPARGWKHGYDYIAPPVIGEL